MYKHHGDEQNRTSQNSWFYEILNERIQYFPNRGTPNVSGGKRRAGSGQDLSCYSKCVKLEACYQIKYF